MAAPCYGVSPHGFPRFESESRRGGPCVPRLVSHGSCDTTIEGWIPVGRGFRPSGCEAEAEITLAWSRDLPGTEVTTGHGCSNHPLGVRVYEVVRSIRRRSRGRYGGSNPSAPTIGSSLRRHSRVVKRARMRSVWRRSSQVRILVAALRYPIRSGRIASLCHRTQARSKGRGSDPRVRRPSEVRILAVTFRSKRLISVPFE